MHSPNVQILESGGDSHNMKHDLPSVRQSADVEAFSLLGLPAELWLQIGSFAVIFPQVICVNHPSQAGNKMANALRLSAPPSIFQVNRSLRAELLPLNYSENVFHISNEHFGAFAWLSSIGEARWRWLRNCCVSTLLWQPRHLLYTWDIHDRHDWDFGSAEEVRDTSDRLPRCAFKSGVTESWGDLRLQDYFS